jgi:amino acid transporter
MTSSPTSAPSITTKRVCTVLAVVSVIASIALFVAGTAGGFGGAGHSTHGEGGPGYFIGALLAMLAAGVFTYLGLTAKPADR